MMFTCEEVPEVVGTIQLEEDELTQRFVCLSDSTSILNPWSAEFCYEIMETKKLFSI